jgi:putative ABC transport system substrate-binding protein
MVRGKASGARRKNSMKVVSRQLSVVSKSVFSLALCALLLTLSPFAAAQQPKKFPRIAFLAGGSRSADSLLLDTFWLRMKELGYVEGKNITAEYRFAEGAPERLANFAAELVRLKVDIIVAPGSGMRAAKKATDTIPIVVTYGDPVGDGFVANLASPGGNVTGLSSFVSELGGKQLEVLKEAFPKISRVAVLWWTEQNALILEDMKLAAEVLRVTLKPIELRTADDLEPAFSTIRKEHANGLITLRNSLTATLRTRIADFAATARLRAIYPDGEFVEAGGLMSYGVNVPDLWGRAAIYVDKILKGAKPADLPVEQPKKFEFVINLKAAKQIGVTIPPNVLARADRVIR